MFVMGQDFKNDLAALDQYFAAKPEAERAQGLMRLARYPPHNDGFLTTRIWRHFGFKLSDGIGAGPTDDAPRTGKPDKELFDRLKAFRNAPPALPGAFTRAELADPDHVAIERLVPIKRGKWRLLPPGVEKHAE
jgi:hypothetical protein